MKAQVCVRSVEQGGASMQQLCEHVKGFNLLAEEQESMSTVE